jgi:hypothetical protein
MKEALRPISKLSSDMSRDRNDPLRKDKAMKALSASLSTIPELQLREMNQPGNGDSATNGDIVSEEKSSQFSPSIPGAPIDGAVNAVKAEIRGDKLVLGNEEISVVKKIQTLSSAERHWDYVFDEASAELLVVLNPSSPLYENTKDLDFYGVLAQADVIATFLTEKRGWKAKEARQTRDIWLTKYFARQTK